LEVYNFLKDYKTDLILNVHDELVFILEPEEKIVDKIIAIMEDYDTFEVPITVEYCTGTNWSIK